MNQSKRLLPKVTRRTDYIPIQQDTMLWLPALKVICQRHDLPSDLLVRFRAGSTVVFAAGEKHIIKLYPPYWMHPFKVECTVAEYIYGRLGIATPEIQAHGDLEGWPYLVISRLSGIYLSDVWDMMQNEDQLRIIAQLGEIVANLHALSTRGLSHIRANWSAFVQKRLSNCEQRYREKGLSEYWLQQIPGYLAHISPLYPHNYLPSIVLGDVHQFHLLVTEKQGKWKLCGLFDFDESRVGFHEYDLSSAGLFMMSGRPQLLRAFLQSYGYPEVELDKTLSARLMAYVLLHGYLYLNWIRKDVIANLSCSTLEEVADVIFGLKKV